MVPAVANCHLFVDFDGTIATVDTTDAILETFADPAWQDVEGEWKAGRIGSRECLVRQIDLVRATPEALDALIATFTVDPHVEELTTFCRTRGIGMTVVSDGLDRSVGTVMRRAGIEAPFFANALEHRGGDRWRLGFPNARSDCRSLSGNCKCAFLEASSRMLKVVVGDGRSDFCMAGNADLVLAKASLLSRCVETGLPHLPFTDFAEATSHLRGWLAEQSSSKTPPAPSHRNN